MKITILGLFWNIKFLPYGHWQSLEVSLTIPWWAVYWSLKGKKQTVIDIYPYVLLPLSIPYRSLPTHRRVFWGPQKRNPALSGDGRPARPNCPSVAIFCNPLGSKPTKQIRVTWTLSPRHQTRSQATFGQVAEGRQARMLWSVVVDLMKQAPALLSFCMKNNRPAKRLLQTRLL